MAAAEPSASEVPIENQIPVSESGELDSSERSKPATTLRLVYGTWAAWEAARKRKNLWVIMCIYGYDETCSLPEDDDMEKALLDRFRSVCGRTRDFMFGKDPFNPQGRCAFIEVWGEEGKYKALGLSGSDVAGLKILVKPAPTRQELAKNVRFDSQSFGVI